MSKKEVWVDYEEISSIPQRRAAPKKQEKQQILKNTKNQKGENQQLKQVPQKLESDQFENTMKNEETQVIHAKNSQNTQQNYEDDYDDLISRRDDYEQSNIDSEEERDRKRQQRDTEIINNHKDQRKFQQYKDDSQSDDEIDMYRESRREQIRQQRDLGESRQEPQLKQRDFLDQYQQQNIKNLREQQKNKKQNKNNQMQQQQIQKQVVKQKPLIILELEQAIKLQAIDKIADCRQRLNKSFSLQEQIQELDKEQIYQSIMLFTQSFLQLSKYERYRQIIKEMWQLSVIKTNFKQFLIKADILFYKTFFQTTIQYLQINGNTMDVPDEMVIQQYQTYKSDKWIEDHETDNMFYRLLNYTNTKPYLRQVEGKFLID